MSADLPFRQVAARALALAYAAIVFGAWILAILAVFEGALSAQTVTAQLRADAARTVAAARAAEQREAITQHAAMVSDVSHAEHLREADLQAMYRQNMPAGVHHPPVKGEQILMFASMAMTRGDMRGMMEAALADPRITIKFLGGEPQGGVPALFHWLLEVGHGLKVIPSFEIDPPSFHKYHVTEVPYAVVLRDGKVAGRVGGVVDSRWIDRQLAMRQGDLGDYGTMVKPSEVDMEWYIANRIKHFDWQAYIQHAVATFWQGLKMPAVPHASTSLVYRIDPSITLTHDIRTPNGILIARKGQRANPESVAPLDVALVVIDASSAAERAFARAQVASAHVGKVMVLSTTVPAHARDGWAVWARWQRAVGVHLYAYLPAMAARLKLTGTPSVVTGDGLYLKVRQVALDPTISKWDR